ncbi:MAG: lipid-A-disaccharide synthase [Gammaproteobacteria bacterium]|nr:lipid-A-disaccharide synthase [Gammaproteobacteria bacterium]
MRLALVAGEASGDLLGAGLIVAISARYPQASFEGIAGPAMSAAGCKALADADELAVMGLVEPLRRLPRLIRLRRSLIRRWRLSPPDAFIGIDAPDFNFGLEAALKSAGIPVAHYVSPSIWAWRAGRIEKIRRACDRVLCLLPFEKKIYDDAGIDAVFVGHPKADALLPNPDTAASRKALGLDDSPLLAILPGSRESEVTRLGSLFVKVAAKLVSARPELQFITPVAVPKLKALIERQIDDAGLMDRFRLYDGHSVEVMAAADIVLLASGTAALEAALLGKPTVAAYRVSSATAFLLRRFDMLKVEQFTLPNQLTETPLIPEFIQDAATVAAISAEVEALFGDADRRAAISSRFAKLRRELALDADQRAADAVIELVNKTSTVDA